MLSKNQTTQLKNQISYAIEQLLSCEEIESNSQIASIKNKYQKAFKILMNNPKITEDKLDFLLGLARGYLEISSKWDQKFLSEMGKTEELVSEIKNSNNLGNS